MSAVLAVWGAVSLVAGLDLRTVQLWTHRLSKLTRL
jgi:hypothetical protein